MLKAEVVAEAMRATPPRITGVMEGYRYRRLSGWRGEGADRVFTFDKLGERTISELTRKIGDVVMDDQVKFVRLSLNFSSTTVACPSCGLKVKSGAAWWSHYNSAHAVRPFWLNRDDWGKMVAEPWQAPPELSL